MMNYRSLFINFRWCNRKTWWMNHHRRLPSVWRPTFSASQVRFAHKIQPRVSLVTENQPVNGSSDTVKNIFNFQSALTCCLSCHWKHEDRFWEGASVCVGQGGQNDAGTCGVSRAGCITVLFYWTLIFSGSDSCFTRCSFGLDEFPFHCCLLSGFLQTPSRGLNWLLLQPPCFKYMQTSTAGSCGLILLVTERLHWSDLGV